MAQIVKISHQEILNLTAQFKAIDYQNNGYISRIDLLNVIYRICPDINSEILNFTMKIITNEEENITTNDFIRAIYVMQNIETLDMAKILFLAVDVDFSGDIQKDELFMILQRLGKAKDS